MKSDKESLDVFKYQKSKQDDNRLPIPCDLEWDTCNCKFCSDFHNNSSLKLGSARTYQNKNFRPNKNQNFIDYRTSYKGKLNRWGSFSTLFADTFPQFF